MTGLTVLVLVLVETNNTPTTHIHTLPTLASTAHHLLMRPSQHSWILSKSLTLSYAFNYVLFHGSLQLIDIRTEIKAVLRLAFHKSQLNNSTTPMKWLTICHLEMSQQVKKYL